MMKNLKLKEFVNSNPRQGLDILNEDSISIKNINKTFLTSNLKESFLNKMEE